jgi:glutaredoxin-like YruB-family protein
MKVTIYSTPTCPWCKRTKDFLTEHKIPFEDINVAADKKAAEEMIKKSKQMGVPVIDIDGQIIVGFDKPVLERARKIS